MLWTFLLSGLGLWSLAGAAGAGLSWSVGFLLINRRRIAMSAPRRPKPRLLADTFRYTVWPLQWRLGLSWFSVTFTLTWLTTLAMLHSGPLAAGQTGLTVALGLVILAFNTNWLAYSALRCSYWTLICVGSVISPAGGTLLVFMVYSCLNLRQ